MPNLQERIKNNLVLSILSIILATFVSTMTFIYLAKDFFGFDLVPRNLYILKTDLTDSYVSKEDYLKLSSELKIANEEIANLKDEQLLISKNIETLNELLMQGKEVDGKHRKVYNIFSTSINTSDFQRWKYRCLAFLKKNDPGISQNFSTATTLTIDKVYGIAYANMNNAIEKGIAVLEGYKLSLVNSKTDTY